MMAILDDLQEDLESAFFRLMAEDIGNESALAFRNQINVDVARHLAHQLARIAIEVMREHKVDDV
jgi:hypothetical protein